jgi:hypothetical protein
MVAAYTGSDDARNKGENCVHFGDGTALPREAVLYCEQVMD